MHKLEARAVHVEAARRALAMLRAAQFPARPPSGDTASEGMRALPNRRRPTRVPPAKIGSVSQATMMHKPLATPATKKCHLLHQPSAKAPVLVGGYRS